MLSTATRSDDLPVRSSPAYACSRSAKMVWGEDASQAHLADALMPPACGPPPPPVAAPPRLCP